MISYQNQKKFLHIGSGGTEVTPMMPQLSRTRVASEIWDTTNVSSHDSMLSRVTLSDSVFRSLRKNTL